MRILLVEDDQRIAIALAETLRYIKSGLTLMNKLQIKQKINNYLDKLPISKLEKIATYIETIYQAEQSLPKSERKTSELGKKLRAIRAEIIAEGEALLTAEQVEIEKKIRQGEAQDN